MRLYPIFFFVVVFCSCGNSTRERLQPQPAEENWQTTRQVLLKHTYNKNGLLDTTYMDEDIYVDGKVGVTLNSFITRSYDFKNNLTDEKTYQVLNKNELSDVKRFAYDTRNNIIEEVTAHHNIVTSIVRRTFNNLNQEVKEVDITRLADFDPKTGNENRENRYDTVIVNSLYDNQGNVIKELRSGSNQKLVTEIIFTQYLEGRKFFSYSTNSRGDTTTVTKFEQSGTQLKSTKRDKIHPFIIYTRWYDGKNLLKITVIDRKMRFRRMETYNYDEKGNVTENTIFK